LIRVFLMLAALAVPLGCAQFASPPPSAPNPPRIEGASEVSYGIAPDLRITGLAAHETARVYSIRMFSVWLPTATGWGPQPRAMVAWADVTADRRGIVRLAEQDVKTGSWRGRDAYGLLWSGRRSDDPTAVLPTSFDLGGLGAGAGIILVERADGQTFFQPLQLAPPKGVDVFEVSDGGLNGAFAVPSGGSRLPTVIILHGSGGGSTAGARSAAMQFAGHGFAAFAINYFAWDFQNIPEIPDVHVNQPIELLAALHAWLAERPEVDADRIGVWGVSKGAEFAEVAAVRFPWIRAVVACVPTDVVWEGYGLGDPRAMRDLARWSPPPAQVSSWSWAGQPLPYVPLRPFREGAYFDNTERYDLSRAESPALAAAAVIPIEESQARFLLLGGGRDEVWASGAMAQRLAERMQAVGRGNDVEVHVFQDAGHGICGDGTAPPRLFADDSRDPRVKDPDAEGRAAIAAWQLTTDFLHRSLRP
jgi:dienelactone hydrolase